MDDEGPIELPPTVIEWIEAKARAYHQRKNTSKSTAQYRAGLEVTASERLVIVKDECAGIQDDEAEMIVIRCLGKSNAVFTAMWTQYNRIERQKTLGDRDVERAKVAAQAPLIQQLRESGDQTRVMFGQLQSFMNRVMDRLEHLEIAGPQQPLALPDEKDPTEG